jgi:hypothetical protein
LVSVGAWDGLLMVALIGGAAAESKENVDSNLLD